MKLIYVINVFPTEAETFVINEINALDELGVPLQVYFLRNGPRDGYGNQIRHLCLVSTWISYSERFSLISALFKNHKIFPLILSILDASRFKIRRLVGSLSSLGHAVRIISELNKQPDEEYHLHAHFAGRTAEVCYFVNHLANYQYSVTVHATDIYVNDQDTWRKIILYNALAIIAISDFGKTFLLDNHIVPDNFPVQVIHCGIDLKRFRISENHHKPNNPKLILSVGRAVEKKGFQYLIEAMATIKQAGISAKLVLIGDGPEIQKIKKMAVQLHVDSVIEFLGTQNNEKILPWYEQADIFVLPCVQAKDKDMDGIPVSLLEAMAYGVPVISTPISGIPELITHELNGILVPPNDSSALAKAMNTLLTDDQLAERLSTKGIKVVEEKFNLEYTALSILEFFSGLYDECFVV